MQFNLLQCQSGRDVSANLQFIETQLKQLPRKPDEAQFVVLPEACLLFGGHESEQIKWAGKIVNHGHDIEHISELKSHLAKLAAKFNVYLVAGTIPALASDGRIYSRSYLFSSKGDLVGQYDKLHLFDVNIQDETQHYRESDTFCPGNNISVFNTPFGRIGLAICYDLRFADLFRALRLAEADIIVIPSAFTAVTGKAHWQTLVQARAIDSQCFILAANQWGSHNQGSRETWGHSMIVDPWGRIISQRQQGVGWVQGSLNFEDMHQIRQAMPIKSHNRFAKPNLQMHNLNT